MDIYEALYTTRMMRRLRPDPIPLDTQARILDAAVRAPNGGNTQRWHFLAVDDPKLIRRFADLFRRARALEYEKFQTGKGPMVATAPGTDPGAHAETMRRMKGSGITWRTISKRFRCCFSSSPSTTSAAPTSTRRSGVRCSPREPRASAAS